MALLSELLKNFGEAEIQKAKELYWKYTNLGSTFMNWFEKNSERFSCQREQIRVLSVFSCDPEIDQQIIQILIDTFPRFRYVTVEPSSDLDFRVVFHLISHSSIQSIEVSPYPSYITLDTIEKFDLIILFGLPSNHAICEHILDKTKLLLREGGSAIALYPNDSIVTDYSLVLHNNMIKNGYEPDSFKPNTISTIDALLESTNTLYHKYMLPTQLSIEPFIRRTRDSELLLSVLLDMDLRDIKEDLYNTIVNKLSSFKVDVTSFYMNYSFVLYYIIGEGVTADAIRRPLDSTQTPWFPEGEQGPFINVGEEHWINQLNTWRQKDVYTCPPPLDPISIDYQEEILDLICDMETPQFELPCITPLQDMLSLYNEEWNSSVK